MLPDKSVLRCIPCGVGYLIYTLQRGTTVTISGLFKPLPVRRKELERNAKREFGKALHLLNAYALVPCASENGGIKLACWNQPAGR